MSRPLRIELRRSAAAGIALVLLLTGAVLLYAAPQRWSTGWMPLALALREYTVLLFPLAAAAGAWQGRREHRTPVAELFGSTPRPPWQRVLPTLAAMGIAVVVACAAIVAAAAPWLAGTVRYHPPAALGVLGVGALSLVAAVWLGMAAGRLLPSPVTAPALAVVSIAVVFFVPFGVPDRIGVLISPMAGSSQFSDYQTFSGRVSAAQVVWLGALAVTAAALVAAGSRRARLAAALPAVLGAGLSLLVLPRGADFVEYPIDTVAQQQVCAEGGPRVCVARVHAGLLPEVVGPARQALAQAARLPGAPVAAEEDTSTFTDGGSPARRTPDVVLMTISADRDGHLAHSSRFAQWMLRDIMLGNLSCPGGEGTTAARAAAAWLLGAEPVPERYQSPEEDAAVAALWRGLRQLPEKEALARVDAAYRAARDCRPVEGLLEGPR